MCVYKYMYIYIINICVCIYYIYKYFFSIFNFWKPIPFHYLEQNSNLDKSFINFKYIKSIECIHINDKLAGNT